MSESNLNQSKEILFLLSGSIAAYKACYLISKLVQNGFSVQVVASASALQFVGPATLEGLTGKPVLSDLWQSGRAMDHIHLIRKADLVLVAPATAHVINRFAHGLGDDLLTTLFLAHDFSKPFLLAPAMNTSMYLHPATQSSLKILRQMGITVLEAASGVLACGEAGYGKLLDPDLLFEEILQYLHASLKSSHVIKPSLKSCRVLITSGGTSEKIDDVRRITNTSTGKTGALVADHLVSLGCDVTLLRSQNSTLPQSRDMQFLAFDDYNSLSQQLQKVLSETNYTHVIHLAAVSDYQVSSVEVLGASESLANKTVSKKIPSGQELLLRLQPTKKLIENFRSWSKNPDLKVAGFKLTSGASDSERQLAAMRVLEHCDVVIGNDLADFRPNSDRAFAVYLKTKKGNLPGLQGLLGFFSNWVMEGVK